MHNLMRFARLRKAIGLSSTRLWLRSVSRRISGACCIPIALGFQRGRMHTVLVVLVCQILLLRTSGGQCLWHSALSLLSGLATLEISTTCVAWRCGTCGCGPARLVVSRTCTLTSSAGYSFWRRRKTLFTSSSKDLGPMVRLFGCIWMSYIRAATYPIPLLGVSCVRGYAEMVEVTGKCAQWLVDFGSSSNARACSIIR